MDIWGFIRSNISNSVPYRHLHSAQLKRARCGVKIPARTLQISSAIQIPITRLGFLREKPNPREGRRKGWRERFIVVVVAVKRKGTCCCWAKLSAELDCLEFFHLTGP